MGITGDDPATLKNWLTDLSFKEVHAMTYGAIHGVGTVVAYLLGFNTVALALVLAVFVLNGWLSTEKTKDFPLVSTVISSLPATIVGQIRDELHYYDGLYLLAVVATFTVASLV